MAKWHVTIMSVDGSEDEDPHQKYGLTIEADSEKEAIQKGEKQFREKHYNFPIFWSKAISVVIFKN